MTVLNPIADMTKSGTATTSSAVLVAANAQRRAIVFQNLGTVNIGLKPAGTASIGTAGTFTIGAGLSMTFEGVACPQDAWHVIAESGTVAVTVMEII